ncbi:MAG: nucleotidyltransferase family protein [Candidatus Odinarchaeia archaeon]
MKKIEEILEILRMCKGELKKKFGVKKLELFGSYVRGEASGESDIDIIVEFEETPDFFKFVQLERHLESILGVKVDLLTRESISPYLRKYVGREVILV